MARYSAEHKRASRERILRAATRLFKTRGYVGTGLNDVMEAAGLTIGTFYAHFESKAALFAEVFVAAAAQSSRWHRDAIEQGRALDGLLVGYLNDKHRVSVETGCPFAAMLSDLPRTPPETRRRIEDFLNHYLATTASALGDGGRPAREVLLATLSVMFGAVALARSVASDKFAREILVSARAMALRGSAGTRRSARRTRD
jgi:AcrR family transcriptional regulator